MTKRSPQQRRSRDRVDRIIRAAAQIIITDGYTRFSTNAVAAKAGVGIASVYEYFDDKHDLLVAVLEREMADIGLEMEARIPLWLEADVDTALHNLFSFALEKIMPRADLVRLAAQYVYGTDRLPAAARFLGQIEMLFRLLLGKFSRAAGRDAALDAYLVTYGFVGICTGIATGLPPGKAPDDVAAWLVRVAKRAIVI